MVEHIKRIVTGIVLLATPLFVPFGFVISALLLGILIEKQRATLNETWKIWSWSKDGKLRLFDWIISGVILESIFQIVTF